MQLSLLSRVMTVALLITTQLAVAVPSPAPQTEVEGCNDDSKQHYGKISLGN